MFDSYAYFDKYGDEDFKVKKANRNRKIDKRAKANEDFQRMNGAGLKSVILPLLAKKAREARKNEKGKP